MTPDKVRKVVEDFPNLLRKQDKLQNRLIKVSGRDSDQEIIILQQLNALERTIELIEHVMNDENILGFRESTILIYRTEGFSYQKIGELFSLSYERIRQILDIVYKKIADVSEAS